VLLRENGTSGPFSAIARVPAGTTTNDDTSASGLGATYTYEVRANGPSGTATSAPGTATTPVLCV